MTTDVDEQDLVKALDNVAGAAASVGGVPTADPAPASGAVSSPFDPAPAADTAVPSYLSTDPAREPVSVLPTPSPSPVPATDDTPVDTPAPAAASADAGPLASIKMDALKDLRPLVGKLNVSPEEKFDTLLLLIRSTDDPELIGPAYDAAKAIPDEARRAEALLDTIKEIDYLSHQKDK